MQGSGNEGRNEIVQRQETDRIDIRGYVLLIPPKNTIVRVSRKYLLDNASTIFAGGSVSKTEEILMGSIPRKRD
jgi:hypothetical protein